MKQDMITGSPAKTLFFFALPMVAGNLFQQLYNIIDSIVVGNYVGADALAAVGASTPVVMLFVAIAVGVSIGCSVIISQFYGAGKLEEMKTSIYTTLISILILGAVFIVAGIFLSKPLLLLLQTPENIMDDAYSYIVIYFLGIGFLFCYNGMTAVFNGLGMSRIPLVLLFSSSLINIGLDLLFVIRFGLGVEGVAWATLIAQAISAVASFIWLQLILRKFETKKTRYFDQEILKNMCRIAIPSSIQQSIVSIGFLFVQALVNSYGSVVVAGYTAATKIDSIAILPMISVGNAMSTFAAQNMGARQPERVSEGYKAALVINAVIAAVITLALYLFGDIFIGAFVDSNTGRDVIAVGVSYLRVVSVFYIIMGLMNITNGILRGTGDVKMFMVTTLCNFSVRVLMAYVLSGTALSASGIWWSIPLGWAVGFLISYLRYKQNKWRDLELV